MKRGDDRDSVVRRRFSKISNTSAAITVLISAVGIRILWVIHASVSGVLFLSGNPLGSGEMTTIATNLAQHRGFSFPFGVGSQPTAWECPIVPLIYAFLIRLAGGPNDRAVFLMIYLQAIVGGFGAWLYWLLIRRLMHRYPSRFAGWLSLAVAVAVCLWPESLASVTQLWYFVWQEAALAMFLLFAFEWVENLSAWRAVLVGLSGGFLALINVTPIPIVVCAIVLVALRPAPRPVLRRSAAIAAVCFIATIAPWLIRNAIVFHSIVPLRSNTGYELFQGNNPIKCIFEPPAAPHPANHGAEFRLYMQMGEIRYCRYSFHRAMQYVRAHPAQTARRIADRIYVTWFSDLTDHWVFPDESPWWRQPLRSRIHYAGTAILILLAVFFFLWGVIRGRFRLLPYAPIFAAILILLPFPHYFTLADTQYTATFRMLVALTSLCMLALKGDTAEVSEQH